MIVSHITEVTRRRLTEGFAQLQLPWSGVLDDVDFLARLYDLDGLPSTDRRHATAAGDIGQQRILNYDWDDDWIFRDERFGLAEGDEALLAFLAEMLHPAVRTEATEVERLREFLNGVLIHDGYELVQVDDISDAPIFAPRRAASASASAAR